jgi:hypothetical protein
MKELHPHALIGVLANTRYGSEGQIEIDSEPKVSVSEDGGVHVQAWCWLERSAIDEAIAKAITDELEPRGYMVGYDEPSGDENTVIEIIADDELTLTVEICWNIKEIKDGKVGIAPYVLRAGAKADGTVRQHDVHCEKRFTIQEVLADLSALQPGTDGRPDPVTVA